MLLKSLGLFIFAITFCGCGDFSSERGGLKGIEEGLTGPSHEEIAAAIPIIDLHADTVLYLASSNPASISSSKLEAGLVNLQKGRYGAQVYVAWVAPEYRPTGFKRANALIDTLQKVVGGNPSTMAISKNAKEIEQRFGEKKISAILGIEGGEAIHEDLNNLDYFYNRGVRYMTLTWNSHNAIADASQDSEMPWNGLSPFGEKVIKRMNELGMLVDISHTSDATVEDVVTISQDPIIASHSNSFTLCDHPRNLRDDLIKKICERGGVIGVNFNTGFLVTGASSTTVKNLANHIDKIVQLGSIECPALGSDFDGSIRPPQDLSNASQLSNLTKELVKRGYSAADIEKIYGRNILRILKLVVGE